MQYRSWMLSGLLVLAAPAAKAQVSLHIDIGLPVAPPMVVVQPGVSVVEGFDGEVFFYSGWYWCRRPDGWYRSRSPRSRFGWVEGPRVPRTLRMIPEGRYRNWRREEHRQEKWERREERREDKRERREERREHGHGHGHGGGKDHHGDHGRGDR